jgi:thioredoxin reductase (NADPH)
MTKEWSMYDLVIVGGGPAGASAATFAGHAGLQTVVLDADKGMTRRAMLYNHLGFPEGLTGPDLVDRGQEQAEKLGAEWVKADVASLERRDDGFVLTAEDGRTFESREVLLASGANLALAKQAGIETRPGIEPRINEVLAVDADGRTSLPGVWAAGVAAGLSVHTIVTAGDGARVAINIISGQKGQRYVWHDVLPPKS